MSKVTCHIEETLILNENGREVDGIIATCSRCGHETESFGTSDVSIRRCLVLMREECPNDESNFYTEASLDSSPAKPESLNNELNKVTYSLDDEAWEVLYINGDYTVGSGGTFGQCMTYWNSDIENSTEFRRELQRVGKVVFGNEEFGCIITHIEHEGNEEINGDLYTY